MRRPSALSNFNFNKYYSPNTGKTLQQLSYTLLPLYTLV